MASNFEFLSSERKSELVQSLKENVVLDQYRDSLLPLIALYENFPLSFIGTREENFDRDELIRRIRTCIEKHIDKYETPSLIIQANVLYVRGSTGGLHVAPHIKMPDLNVFIDAPESEEAKRAAGFVRTGAMQELMVLGDKRIDGWPKIILESML